ncbi:hypothetical protein [Flaviaesturariibacter aridisoli]|uniref:hypothetical protein n=1 Tax=Flaviaesturariibacter aridisoli TaxID=2545761 RepID=UPI0014051239|nr:hypothetical protein [Flaviaesturariibacter aridisoli]
MNHFAQKKSNFFIARTTGYCHSPALPSGILAAARSSKTFVKYKDRTGAASFLL